jgi:hypothetical protein
VNMLRGGLHYRKIIANNQRTQADRRAGFSGHS